MQKNSLAVASVIATVVFVGAGCAKEAAVTSAPNVVAPVVQAPAPVVAPTPGKIDFDFPIKKSTSARVGEYVLAPSGQSIKSGAGGVYIYYAAKLIEKGDGESKVQTLSGAEEMIPNSLIIPLGNQQTAKPGDIVLTWWQTGSGMERAIVTGGTPTEPGVLYLDQDFKESAKSEKLPAGSFSVLPSSTTPGNIVACGPTDNKMRYQVVATETDKYLALGWAGKMLVVNSSECSPIPHDAGAKVGDKIFVPVFSKYTEATVTKIDAKKGRVWAKYKFAGSEEEKAFSFGEIAKVLF